MQCRPDGAAYLHVAAMFWEPGIYFQSYRQVYIHTMLQVDEAGNIVDSCFKTFGCGSAIASSSVATEWYVGPLQLATSSMFLGFL